MSSRLHQTLLIYAFAISGVFLVLAPWTPIWDRTLDTWVGESIAIWFRGGAVRGAVSGLGIFDLGYAILIGQRLVVGQKKRGGEETPPAGSKAGSHES